MISYIKKPIPFVIVPNTVSPLYMNKFCSESLEVEQPFVTMRVNSQNSPIKNKRCLQTMHKAHVCRHLTEEDLRTADEHVKRYSILLVITEMQVKITMRCYTPIRTVKKCVCVCVQSCLTLCNPMDCSLPGSSVHGIFQARIVEWIAISSSRGSSQPRD